MGKKPVLTSVTIPHATATSELVGKIFIAEEAGSIFLKSTTRGALSLLRGAGIGIWREDHIEMDNSKRPLFGRMKMYTPLRQMRKVRMGGQLVLPCGILFLT